MHHVSGRSHFTQHVSIFKSNVNFSCITLSRQQFNQKCLLLGISAQASMTKCLPKVVSRRSTLYLAYEHAVFATCEGVDLASIFTHHFSNKFVHVCRPNVRNRKSVIGHWLLPTNCYQSHFLGIRSDFKYVLFAGLYRSISGGSPTPRLITLFWRPWGRCRVDVSF